MAVNFLKNSSRMYLEKDGVKHFDTDAHPVQFFPIADAIIKSISIDFPDLTKENAYAFARGSDGANFLNSCASFITMPYQEWGPAGMLPAPDFDLPDVVVGTVPGATDLLNIRVKLSRTNTPSQINGNAITPQLAPNEWVDVPGGAFLVEMLPPLMRMARFMLSPTLNPDGTKNVILRRTQSVSRKRYTYWRSDGNPGISGWTHNGAARGAFGHIVSQRDVRGPVFLSEGSTALARGQPAGCLLGDNTNYQSLYSGQVSIIPGVSLITPETAGGGTAGKAFMLVDERQQGSGPASTFNFSNLDLGYDAAHRQIFVMVIGYSSGNTGNNDISGVNVAGGAATQVQRARNYTDVAGANDTTLVSAIYRRAVPTGGTGTVSVSFTGTYQFCRVYVFAAYGLVDSGAPFWTAQGTQNKTNFTLNTPAEGYVIGAMIGPAAGGVPFSVTGLTSYFSDNAIITNPWQRENFAGWGSQTSSGETQTLRASSDLYPVGSGAFAFCLASFK